MEIVRTKEEHLSIRLCGERKLLGSPSLPRKAGGEGWVRGCPPLALTVDAPSPYPLPHMRGGEGKSSSKADHARTDQILYRRGLDRAGCAQAFRRRRSGDRNRLCAHLAGLVRRRRSRRRRRPQGVRDLVAHHARRAAGAASPDQKRIRDALRRPRRGDHLGDGGAAVAVARGAGRGGPAAPGRDHPCAERIRLRGAQWPHHAAARAHRRVRADHAVELADQPDRAQGLPGARGRLHDGAQAQRDDAGERHDRGRDHPCRRHARGRVQSRQRRWAGGRPGDRGASRHRHGVVHRLDPRRRRGDESRPPTRSSA